MENITSAAKLKNAIQLLEVEKAIREALLKEQFHHVIESIKPLNVIKKSLKEIVTTPSLTSNFSGTIMGLVSGFFTKKIVTGSSKNIFRKLIGSALQFGVTNIVAKHSETIQSFGQIIYEQIAQKKEHHSAKK